MSGPEFKGLALYWSLPADLAYYVDALVRDKGYNEIGPYQSRWEVRVHYSDSDFSPVPSGTYLRVFTPTASPRALQSLSKHVEELLKAAQKHKSSADRVASLYKDALTSALYADRIKSWLSARSSDTPDLDIPEISFDDDEEYLGDVEIVDIDELLEEVL